MFQQQRKEENSNLAHCLFVGEGFTPPGDFENKITRRKAITIYFLRKSQLFLQNNWAGGVNPSPTTQRNISAINWNLLRSRVGNAVLSVPQQNWGSMPQFCYKPRA